MSKPRRFTLFEDILEQRRVIRRKGQVRGRVVAGWMPFADSAHPGTARREDALMSRPLIDQQYARFDLADDIGIVHLIRLFALVVPVPDRMGISGLCRLLMPVAFQR